MAERGTAVRRKEAELRRLDRIAIALAALLTGAWMQPRTAISALPFSFAPQTDYATNRSPWWVAAADLNGDHAPDLVVANAGSSTVSVLLGRGDGTFLPRVDYVVGASPRWVSIADLDRDGHPDVITANSAASTLSALRGRGDGTLEPHVDYPAGPGARCFAIGDLNEDGRDDIVAADPDSNRISVLVALPGGGFGAPQPVATGGSSPGLAPYFVVLGDLNRDGHLDAVVANHAGGSVSSMLGRGDGTFQPRLDYLAGSDLWQVALADFDRDSVIDFVAVSAYECRATVQLGVGDGTFRPRRDFDPGCGGYALAAADFNADGKTDVAVSYDSYYVFGGMYLGGFTLHPGAGTGSFGSRTVYTTGLTPTAITAADLDGNLSPDIVVVNSASSTVSVFLNAIPFGLGFSSEIIVGRSPITWGEAAAFTAYVAPDSATGSIVFRDGATDLGTATIANARATFTANGLLAGRHAITGWHAANGTFPEYTSPTVWQTVLQAPSKTTVTSSADTITRGQFVRFDVTVSAQTPALGTPQGSAIFYVDNGPAGSPVTLTAGRASSAPTDTLKEGLHFITAAYVPADTMHFGQSAASRVLTVLPSLPTPAQSSFLPPTFESGGVRVAWLVSPEGTGTLWIHRTCCGDGWRPLAEVLPDVRGMVQFLDTTIRPGERYGYRLAHRSSTSAETVVGEGWVDVPGDADTLSVRVRNPVTQGDLEVSFAAAGGRSVHFELLDLGGRVVASRWVQPIDGTRRTYALARSGAFAPGIYLVRVGPAPCATRKVVILR